MGYDRRTKYGISVNKRLFFKRRTILYLHFFVYTLRILYVGFKNLWVYDNLSYIVLGIFMYQIIFDYLSLLDMLVVFKPKINSLYSLRIESLKYEHQITFFTVKKKTFLQAVNSEATNFRFKYYFFVEFVKAVRM